MALVTSLERDMVSMRQAIARLSSIKLGPTSTPKFADLTLTGNLTVGGNIDLTGTLTLSALTASRLIATNASKELVSSNLNNWIAATADETTVTDDGDGTVTIGIADPLIVSKGGTGRATSTTAYGLIAAGTTATGALQTLSAGLTTQILVGGGAAALPSWSTDIPTAVTIGTAYIYRAGGTDVPVDDGGSGASTFTDHSILLGSGTDPFTALGAATNGQLPIGSTGNDPVLAGITGTADQITVTNGAGSITLSLPQNIDTAADIEFQSLLIDQDTNAVALEIDSEATTATNYGLKCVTGAGAWAAYISYGDANNGAAYLGCNPNGSAGASFNFTRNLAAASTDCAVLRVANSNAGDDQACVEIDQDADGYGLDIDSEATTSTKYGLRCVTGAGAITALFSYGAVANGSAYLGCPNNQGFSGNFVFARDLAAASTDGSVVYIHQDNAGDDQPALEIQQDGSGYALLTNGNIKCDGDMTVTGTTTYEGNIVIPDAGYIGSVSDTDAIQIEADGDVVMSQMLAVTGDIQVTGNILLMADRGGLGYTDNSPMIVFDDTNNRVEFIGNIMLADDGTIGVSDGEPSILFDNTDGQVEVTGILTVSSNASITGTITASNYTAANLLTACATNAGALDFSAAGKTLTVEDDAIVSQDYSSDASPTFTGLTLSGITQGSVIFAGASGVLSQDNSNFFWDDTNKHLGIGINSGLDAGITVFGGGDVSKIRIFDTDNNTGAPELIFNKTRGAVVQDGDYIGNFFARGYDGSAYRNAAGIYFRIDGTPGSGDMPGSIIFLTTPDGSATPAARLTIDSVGLSTFTGSIISANYEASNKLTACATNAGALDFSAASKTLTVEDNAVVSQDYSSDASPVFAGLGIGITPVEDFHVYHATHNTLAFFQSGDSNIHFKLQDQTSTEYIGIQAGVFWIGSTSYPGTNTINVIDSNFAMGLTALGTNAANVIGIRIGTAPTSSPANCFQMYSADIAAGHAACHIRNENDTIIKLYQQAHIADATTQDIAGADTVDETKLESDLSGIVSTINSILSALENNGLLAAV